jgi:hypothetical protein
VEGAEVGYDPDDYDEVYETTSKSEHAELLRNGWVLLDERIETVGSVSGEPVTKTWTRAAMRYTGGGGFWSGAGREQPEPEPPQTVTTYVLGWPKGQQTVSEEEAGFTEPPHE